MAQLAGQAGAGAVGARMEVPEAPRTLGEMVKWLGPGLALAAVLIGSGEAVLSPWVGAQVGIIFMWVIVAALLMKWFMNELVGRYTLVTGETIYEGFTKVPGPRGWAAHVNALTNYGKITFTYGSIISLTAQVIQFISGWNLQVCVYVTIGTCVLALLTGKFDFISNILTVLVAVMIVFAFYAGIVAISNIGLGTWLSGFVPNLGNDQNRWLILGMYGYVGGATSNTLYSWWIKEKKMGAVALREAGAPIEMTPTNVDRLQRWMRLMHLDLGNGYFWTAAVSIVFYTAAVAFLHPRGLVAQGLKAIQINSEIWSQISSIGVALYLAGVFAALWTSISGQWDGSARSMVDWWEIFVTKKPLSERGKYWAYLIFVAFFVAGGLATATFVASPVQLIALFAIVDTLGYLIATAALAWLCRRFLPKQFQIAGLWYAFVIICLLVYIGFAVYDTAPQLSKLKIF